MVNACFLKNNYQYCNKLLSGVTDDVICLRAACIEEGTRDDRRTESCWTSQAGV